MNTNEIIGQLILLNYDNFSTILSSGQKVKIPSQLSRRSKENQMHNLINDEAKQYFVESGILGATNFKVANDFFQKTSTIHNDTTLQNKIRKKSLCLRSRTLNDKNGLNTGDDLIIHLQNEIYNVKKILELGETKIITLRTEIVQIKGALREIMKSQVEAQTQSEDDLLIQQSRFCVFCQPSVSCSNLTNKADRVLQKF